MDRTATVSRYNRITKSHTEKWIVTWRESSTFVGSRPINERAYLSEAAARSFAEQIGKYNLCDIGPDVRAI